MSRQERREKGARRREEEEEGRRRTATGDSSSVRQDCRAAFLLETPVTLMKLLKRTGKLKKLTETMDCR